MIKLARYRNQVLSLDSARALTRGTPVGLSSWLPLLQPVRGSHLVVASEDGQTAPLVGQMVYFTGERSAHLSFVTPESACDSPLFSRLVEYLAIHAGEHGAFNLLAEIEDTHPALESLRRSGFSVYSWQQVFRLPDSGKVSRPAESLWQPSQASDEPSIRSLYQSLVPPLVQGAEPFLSRDPSGLVYRQGGEVLGFVEALSGLRGIFIVPLIHPEVQDVSALLADLIHVFPGMGRPLYLAVRSYQSWLEVALSQMGAAAAPRQALLVKHLVMSQRNAVSRLNVLERRQAEPTTSIIQSSAVPEDGKPVTGI